MRASQKVTSQLTKLDSPKTETTKEVVVVAKTTPRATTRGYKEMVDPVILKTKTTTTDLAKRGKTTILRPKNKTESNISLRFTKVSLKTRNHNTSQRGESQTGRKKERIMTHTIDKKVARTTTTRGTKARTRNT
jgi:hypothetical protein